MELSYKLTTLIMKSIYLNKFELPPWIKGQRFSHSSFPENLQQNTCENNCSENGKRKQNWIKYGLSLRLLYFIL